jgi:diacylglycerol kinase family enzyme
VSNAQRIPAFVNPESGTAEGARDALSAASLFDIHEVHPSKLGTEIQTAVKAGASRILVSGGDGTIRTGAAAVAGTDVELAILPAGTLNHFAKDHGIPEDFEEATRVAANGTIETADAAYVGDELFLNTSSIGAYVRFMRVRERLEKRLGYKLASLIASISTFFYMRSLLVEVEVEGQKRTYRTPIVFIGVGERELQMPTLGNRVKDGKRGLHVMVVGDRRKGRLLALAWEAMSRGVESAARSPELDAFIVDSCTISMHRRETTVALDGEAVRLAIPLKYRFERDILRVVRGE